MYWYGMAIPYICWGSILSLVQIFFSFVSNSLSCYYHTLPYPKTEEKKIWTKDKIEPQHIQVAWTRKGHGAGQDNYGFSGDCPKYGYILITLLIISLQN